MGEVFDAVLDSGATLNIISERAAGRLSSIKLLRVNKNVQVVGQTFQIRKAMAVDISIGSAQAHTVLYVARSAPADILLGHPFLSRFSEGYRMMQNEFMDASMSQTSQVETCLALCDDLEDLLKKVPRTHPRR